MTSKEIPVSNERLFVGKGFRWEQKHTQRLVDTYLPQYAPYVEPSEWTNKARRLEARLEFAPFPLTLLAKTTAWDNAANPFRPLPPVGGLPRLHGIEPEEHDVTLPLGERVGHSIVLGTTRVGKTRLNVYFDNSIRLQDGSYEDRGGFWANVQLWHRDAESYSRLYQKGMRVLIDGRAVLDTWKDGNGEEQAAIKVQANRIAFLPQRIESITMGQNTGQAQSRPVANGQSRAPAPMPAPTSDDFDDQIPY